MIRLRHRLPLLACLLSFSGCGFADAPLPSSELRGNAEIFDISCPGNPQQTTLDIDGCMRTKRAAVEAVEANYVNTARQRIAAEADDPAGYRQQMLDAFEAENRAWDALIAAGTHATGVEWQGGTVRGNKATYREIMLVELRIHNQWQNWLRYEDSTPAVLPEPKFNNEE